MAGIAAGTLIAFSADAIGPRSEPAPSNALPSPVASAPETRPGGDPAKARKSVLLVWSPRGLPAGFAAAIGRVPGAEAVTTVKAQLDWLLEARSSDGAVLDKPQGGRAIPFEVAGIDPGEYARFVLPSERAAVGALGPGDMLIARTEAELRRGAEGLHLRLAGGDRTVVGVLSDETSGGYEGLVRLADLPDRAEAEEFVLVLVDSMDRRAAFERRVSRLLADRVYRTRFQGETPFLRYGDAVLPQMMIKRWFGEFAAQPRPDGTLEMDPGWVKGNLATARLPLIGRVVCHQAIVPQLRAALEEVVAEDLAFTVDRSQYAGCYGARFVNRDPNGRISHHAWAIALDINAATNPFGDRPRQDRRLVRIMESHGFTWGGRWLIPDGMHFEWARFP